MDAARKFLRVQAREGELRLDWLEPAAGTHQLPGPPWSGQPAPDADPSWWAARLTAVRVFARYLAVSGERTEVPPEDLLPRQERRTVSPLLIRQITHDSHQDHLNPELR